ANVSGLADHHARAVIDEQALADTRGGMDLDARQYACEHRDLAWQQRHARLLQRMRSAMSQQRMNAGPGGEDLDSPHTTRRGIAVASGKDVATQLSRDLGKHAEARHVDS